LNRVRSTLTLEPDYTVLVGENNSGKSNILDAMYASLRVNRTVKQGAFELHDYHLADSAAMAGDAGQIVLTLRFEESAPDDWDDEFLAAFNDVLALDAANGQNRVVIRVTSSAPASGEVETYDWDFLDANESAHQKKNIASLNRLQTLRPFFHLPALRDAAREFSNRSSLFSPFVNDPTFDDELRKELIDALSEINEKVLDAHEAFTVLRDNIATGNALLAGDDSGVVIEAVPSRLSELLANTQVSLQDKGGATLPLDRQGSGSQSLAVFSLFKAFVQAKLASKLDPLSRPILTIEEPEAHLHPSAARSLWQLISSINAQALITSHSGDLLGEVPLRCVRRLKQTGSGARVFSVNVGLFGPEELRHINYAVRAARGELYFANLWLLVEGRSEAMCIPELARAIGTDLISGGVRVIEYQQAGGPGPFIKLADQLGIGWHCLCDSDDSGKGNEAKVDRLLNGRPRNDHVTVLGPSNLEGFFCSEGFVEIYEAHAANEKRKVILHARGTPDYAHAIALAIIDRRKERAALEVCAEIAQDHGKAPMLLRRMFEVCFRLAQL